LFAARPAHVPCRGDLIAGHASRLPPVSKRTGLVAKLGGEPLGGSEPCVHGEIWAAMLMPVLADNQAHHWTRAAHHDDKDDDDDNDDAQAPETSR
jgi:hypothetical protein